MEWVIGLSILAICVNYGSATQTEEFLDAAAIYSRLTTCDYYKSYENNYTHFVELSSLKEPQPNDLYARVPFYVIGPRDAHIVLSTTDTPIREKDPLYEIALGAAGNTRTIVRKRIHIYPLRDITHPPVLSERRLLKVLIEVSKSGHIKIFTDNKAKPLVEAYDPFVLPVKYVSFASYDGAPVVFLYNCVPDNTTQDRSSDAPDSTTIPGDLSAAPLDYLVKKCEVEEAWELQYKKFHEIKTLKNTQSEGYLFKMNFHVYGNREVHVMLSATEKLGIDKVATYEIVLGGFNNERQVIRKTINGTKMFEKLQYRGLISEQNQTRIKIQMTNDGAIEIFVGDSQYEPTVFEIDPNPIDVKYVSFASYGGTRVLFFYNCDDDDEYPLPTVSMGFGSTRVY